MTDVDALITEADELSERWAKLDAELTGMLREFAVWMLEKFPITSTPSQWKHVPAAHSLFPTPSARDGWVELSREEPVDNDGFFFLNNNGDGWHLPFAWLQDREAFFQAVLTRSHAQEREAEAKAAQERAKEAERLRARLAELRARLAELESR